MRRSMVAFVMFVTVLCLAFSAEAGSKAKAKKYYKAGLKLAKAQKFDEAASKYRAALSENPKMYLAALDLGMVFKLQERLPEAVAAYELAARLKPDRVKAVSGYADALVSVGAHKSAAEQYRALTKLEPDTMDTFKKLGASALLAASYDTPSYESAIGAFLQVLSKNSGDFQATIGLGQAYYGQHKLDKALEKFKSAANLKPESFSVWKGLGEVYQEKDKLEEARKAYQKACDLSGGKSKSICKLARLL